LHYPSFVGVDGEGGNIGKVHKYLLLRAGDDTVENAEGLSLVECLSFLCDLPKADRIYVSFAFDYDVTMMLRQAHPSRVQRLFDRESRRIIRDGKPVEQYHPVEIGEFEVDYLPHKEFKVRRKGSKKYTVVNDVFTFFQTSFVVALRKWFPEDEYKFIIGKIAEGKDQRHDFGAVTDDERKYNATECVMLVQLMSRFRDMCYELDIRPRKWQGPGYLVSAVFQRESMPDNRAINVPTDILSAANTAYIGGRFEARSYGPIEGPVYQYDINSAYASYYRFLPCLVHGTWRRIRPGLSLPRGPIYLANVSFKHGSGLAWNTLGIRSDKGAILFPREGQGWYWSHELEVAQKYADIEVHEGWQYERHCDCSPFEWVYPLYDLRASVGKDSGRGKVLKTTLATIYGKTAQSVGNPRWSNPIWAGLITSSCRARLIEATLSVDGGRNVHMLATDGLFSTAPITSLCVGKALGEWELTEHESIFIVQSGLYLLPDRVGKVLHKTRGVPLAKVIEYQDDIRQAFDQWMDRGDVGLDRPTVSIRLVAFISLRVANARKKGWLAGKWLNTSKVIGFDWYTKRAFPVVIGRHVETVPVPGSPWLVSRAPERMIGGRDLLETALYDGPDWADRISDDGCDG
jgi:hypothetical protein